MKNFRELEASSVARVVLVDAFNRHIISIQDVGRTASRRWSAA
jgi:hypothetical protein